MLASVSTEPKRLPRKVREQQMLDAAVEVFSSRGYHAASMDEIAERAKVSKPLLYMYLGSKEETFAACVTRESDRFVDTIGVAIRAEVQSPGERLWRGLLAFFTYVTEHRASWTVLYQQARSLNDSLARQVARIRGEIIATVTELVLQAKPDYARSDETDAGYAALRRESAATAHALVGAADAMAEWALTTPDEEPSQTALRLMNMVWTGMERGAKGEHFIEPDDQSALTAP
jgi:AcrR family transcriptional regulator